MKPIKQSRLLETDEAPAAMQNDIDMDSSDDKQQQALGSLWKSTQEETKNNTEEQKEEEEPDESWDNCNWGTTHYESMICKTFTTFNSTCTTIHFNSVTMEEKYDCRKLKTKV
jgi:hypothetical protein